MFSYYLVFSLGLALSALSIGLWYVIVRSQLAQYNGSNSVVKNVLLFIGVVGLFANFVPIWFDIYRLMHQVNLSNIFYAYTMNNYLYRTLTALGFWIIYKYLVVE